MKGRMLFKIARLSLSGSYKAPRSSKKYLSPSCTFQSIISKTAEKSNGLFFHNVWLSPNLDHRSIYVDIPPDLPYPQSVRSDKSQW